MVFYCLLLVVQAEKINKAAGFLTAEEVAAEQFKRNQGRKKGDRREMTSEGTQVRLKDRSSKQLKRRNCRL